MKATIFIGGGSKCFFPEWHVTAAVRCDERCKLGSYEL
jgi:hypothetical protein